MPVYTVHEPPQRAPGALAEPERFVFVRDGFYWWAFLLTPFWMLRQRLWLVLVLYVVVSIAIDSILHVIGASGPAIALIEILLSLLIGLEASTLIRFILRRRGWRNIGIVSGDDLEDAERRFFDIWVRRPPARSAAPAQPTPPAPPSPPPGAPGVSGVIGLFPEPGAQR